jgi:hypothetical membrane protein
LAFCDSHINSNKLVTSASYWLQGIKLAVLQILGAVCVGLIATYVKHRNPLYYTEVLFFLLVATAFLITTTCLLLSSFLSFITASMIHKTLFVSISSARREAVTALHRRIIGALHVPSGGLKTVV